MSETLSNLAASASAFLRLLSDPAPKAALVENPNQRGGSVVVVRNDYKLERLPGAEVSRRAHVFHELGSFADWLKRFGTERDKVEILVGDTEAKAVLGDSPYASLVSCQLRHHPTFKLWANAFREELDPKEFHGFIRSVAGTFGDADAGVTMADVLSGELQKLKAVKQGDIAMQLDPRGFYSVSGNTTSVQVDAKIPPSFKIRTPIFVGIPQQPLDATDVVPSASDRLYDLEILLAMDVGDDSITFTVSCPRLEAVMHEARLDAVEHLRGLLGDGFLVGLGDLTTAAVAG